MFKTKILLASLIISLTSITSFAQIDFDQIEQEREQAELKLVDKATKSIALKMEEVLVKNPELNKSFDAYIEKTKEVLSNKNLTDAEKNKILSEQNNKQRPALKQLLSLMNIDTKPITAFLNTGFANLGKKYNRVYSWRYEEAHSIFWKSEEISDDKEMFRATATNTVTTTLRPPFNSPDTFALGRSHLDLGLFYTSAVSVGLGEVIESNGIGHFFSRTKNKIQLKSSIGSTKWWLGAFAVIGITSTASAKSKLRLQQDDRTIATKTRNHGSIYVVVLWFVSVSDSDIYTLSTRFQNVSQLTSDSDFTLSFKTTSKASALGLAEGVATANTTVRDFVISQKN